MRPDLTARIGPDWRDKLRVWRAQPVPLIVISDRWGGFFGPLRNLVGVEKLCMLFYDDPAFVEEMMEAMPLHHCDPGPNLTAPHALLCGRHGLQPRPIDLRHGSHHAAPLPPRRLRPLRVKYIGLDSDGQVDLLIPVRLDAA
jgi:uroporphyrinogen decarboxylase